LLNYFYTYFFGGYSLILIFTQPIRRMPALI